MAKEGSKADLISANINDTTANAGCLGLMGFGMTTVLLNMHNAGFFKLNVMILAMGIFMGGLAQVIAGIMEWKKNNTFGMTAFTCYGFFWLSLIVIWLFPEKLGETGAPDGTAMASYFFMWGLFTLVMFVGTLRANKASMVVFGSLAILFFLLTAVKAGYTGLGTITGYEGIFCGFSAIYAALAQVLNEVYGRVVLPLGPVGESNH
ncbi:MAG TPA: acetate uptake transporter [Syntrophomonadaceae bacterium]|nr:acetate uptake transporter [Syntrophomonadaceae bacterium]